MTQGGVGDDGHDKPFILDNGQIRYLYFSFDFIQSSMRISDPDALDLRYTQKMMAFLLFNPDPRNVAVIGLGGGSIVKYCYRQLPLATIHGVEINPHVVALRDEFCVPADDERLSIHCGDGAAFVAGLNNSLDALLIDAYDREGIASGLSSREFFRDARRSLAAGGVLVVNLAGNRAGFAPAITAISEVFEQRVVGLQVRDDEHHILFAFKDGPQAPDWPLLHRQASGLRKRFGLDFPAFARKLEQAARAQLVWALSTSEPNSAGLAGLAPESAKGPRQPRRARKPDRHRGHRDDQEDRAWQT